MQCSPVAGVFGLILGLEALEDLSNLSRACLCELLHVLVYFLYWIVSVR